MYVLPSPDNTQQITEALAKVTQLHRLPQAKPDVFRGEEEDKTKFFLWESAFDALIDSVPVAPRQKLHLLFQHLEGRAKKVVEQLQFMIEDPEKAYKESRKRLKYRFGNSAILSADFEKRLTNWPKIGNSDAKGIQEFSDFLQQVEIARDHIPSLKIFDFSSKLQSLVEKLPGCFKTKWSTKVQKLQQTDGHNAFPSFSEFVKEVNFHSERMNIPQISQASLGSINQRAAPNQSTSSRRGSQTSTGQGSQITALATQSSPDGERSPTKSILKDSKSTATPDSLGTASTVNTAFCPYHRTKSHDLEDCQKFRKLDFSERKDFLFKKGFCFNCASSNKHISKHCDKGRPQCKICARSHVTALHDPSRPENNSSQASSACTRVCKDGPRRSCARIILLKVSDQSDPLKETLTYAVLDDQSTDVFITDAHQSKLNLSGAEVNLQVNTIVGTNTVRMRRVPGLQIQDINGEYSPVKVPYAYAQPKIPATHSDITTPDIVRQWDHLKDVADEVHYRSDIDIGMLIGRNVPTAFQPLKVIYGEADEPWAEKYKFGWTIIGPVCLDKAKPQQCSSVSVNCVTVQREELPDSCILNVPQASNPLHQQDSVAVLVNKLRSKDVTSPQIIREMMELDYSELNYSRKICANE